MSLARSAPRRLHAAHAPSHRWPLWLFVAALLLLAACDPKKGNPPPKPETGPLTTTITVP